MISKCTWAHFLNVALAERHENWAICYVTSYDALNLILLFGCTYKPDIWFFNWTPDKTPENLTVRIKTGRLAILTIYYRHIYYFNLDDTTHPRDCADLLNNCFFRIYVIILHIYINRKLIIMHYSEA